MEKTHSEIGSMMLKMTRGKVGRIGAMMNRITL
jgi:hypothetical protein